MILLKKFAQALSLQPQAAKTVRYAMLVKRYRTEFCLPPNPKARHLRCYAHLDGDITEILPRLNTVLGGYQYCKEPPMLTLKFQAKLITLYPKMIAINIVTDEAEAANILEWLKKEINHTWERREEIKPSFETAPKPGILNILRLLPKTNCRECGQPTCLVFAIQVSEGARSPDDCPPLDRQNRRKIHEYLAQFGF
jgi:ArsR family metal-binding transcriptional regulator